MHLCDLELEALDLEADDHVLHALTIKCTVLYYFCVISNAQESLCLQFSQSR